MNLTFTITASAPSRPKGKLCVVVGYKGISQGRKSYVIEGLTNPDFRYWDKKAQCFSSGTDTARANNPVLEALRARCNELVSNSAITTPEAFIEALKSGVAPSDVETLGHHLRSIIDDIRTGLNHQCPSRNYQPYLNLLHKLEKEATTQYKGKKCNLIDVPLSDVDNKHFIQFSEFLFTLSNEEGRSNYINLMKLFKQVHTKAYDLEYNNHTLRFNYTKFAPKTRSECKQQRPSLTPKQYAKFVSMDVRKLPKSGSLSYELMEMYKDYCIFLYETKMRPVDVTGARFENIVKVGGVFKYRYIPEKKKNKKHDYDATLVYTPLSDRALAIIEKYKGKSSQGYIFPFSMNEYHWDMMDAESWNKWNNRKTRLQEMINKWLKKVAKALKLDIDLTLYTFRHSTLTHACAMAGANWGAIAQQAGTSVEMLEKHYVAKDAI